MSSNFITLPQRLRLNSEQWRARMWQTLCDLRVAIPAVVQSFDSVKQTVTVLPAIMENLNVQGVPTPTQLPLLTDIPILIPRAGNFALTMPVQAGDECLVIFADMCFDAWWANGAAQGPQVQAEKRRHDLSDGIAILGCWSQPNVLSNYSTTAAQLRSEDGTVVVEVTGNAVDVTAPTVNVNGSQQVNVQSSTLVNINGSGHTTIEGKDFLAHKHSGIQPGSGQTGGVV